MNQMYTQKKLIKCPQIKLEFPELDKYLDQSYILDNSENYEAFLIELGVRKHVRTRAIKSKPTITLSRVKHKYVLTTSYPEGRCTRVKFKPGKEIIRWGKTSSVFQIVDSTIIEEQNTDDTKVLIEREFKKQGLRVTMALNDVKCYRWYNLLEVSKHSIETETSRRSYLWKSDTSSTPSLIESMTPEETSVEEEAEEEEKVCY